MTRVYLKAYYKLVHKRKIYRINENMDITKTENYFHSVCLSVCLSVCSQLELKDRKLLILDFLTIVFVLNFSFVIMRQMNEISGELAWAVVLMASINSCFANSGSNRALGKSIRQYMRNICYIYSAYGGYIQLYSPNSQLTSSVL